MGTGFILQALSARPRPRAVWWFFIGSKNVLFVEPPVGIKQTALRGKKSRTKLHTKLGLLVSMIFTISVETTKSFSS